MIDVAVIGAGPAGSAAAKRCAEFGLETVILEKKRLPRDKVCSGMIIGTLAHTLIKQEFGEIPETVLSDPCRLNGYIFHAPDIDNRIGESLDFSIPLTWRRKLDLWMATKAVEKGAQIKEGAKVIGVVETKKGAIVKFLHDRQIHEVRARFVIGADGGTSVARKCLFPQLKVPFAQAYEECHLGSLDLDPRYFHWFYLKNAFPGGFAVHQKDKLTVLEFGGTVGVPKTRIKWAKNYLVLNHGFEENKEPVYRGACAVAKLTGMLISGIFFPAMKNTLIVGEAGGFVIPITGEGIGTGIKSGLLAAESIIQSIKAGQPADNIYLKEIKPIITAFKDFSVWFAKIEAAVKGDGDLFRKTLARAHQASLQLF